MKKVLYEYRKDIILLGVVVAITLSLFVFPKFNKDPQKEMAQLLEPFDYWFSYLIVAMALIGGYVNGVHQKTNILSGISSSLLIAAVIVFGIDYLYSKSLGLADSNLILSTTYLSYSLSRLIAMARLSFLAEKAKEQG
jgi:hypothetical protein